jgi:hypothetical protein
VGLSILSQRFVASASLNLARLDSFNSLAEIHGAILVTISSIIALSILSQRFPDVKMLIPSQEELSFQFSRRDSANGRIG